MGVVLVFRDVSERRRGEEKLRLRNERLALLSETAAQLLGAQDPNEMVRELFARVSNHLNVQAYFNFMVDEDGKRLRLDSFAGIPDRAARLIAHLEFGQAVCGTVAQTRQRIHARDVQTSGDPMVELIRRYGIRAYCCHPLTAGERLLGTLSFGSRVVNRFEEEELDFMRTVCHYVAIAKERLRLEKELHERVSQLAEADVRKNEFLAMLAHELRNPLAAISSAIQFLRIQGPADPSLQRARDAADRQAGHMTSLLDDLLDVSRVTQGKVTLKKSDIDLASAVESAVDATMPLIKEKGLKFYMSTPQELLILNADPVRLTQVVSNLLHNAAKYTPYGGEIRLSVECDKDHAAIRVRDNGVGIEPKLLPYVFDLFVQSDRSPDRAQGGLGIGLTLVRTLVEMHGGRVEARSDGPSKGSEFIVRFPLSQTQKNIPQKEATKAGVTGPRRILVVDDNADAADMIAALLGIDGHEVITAHNGNDAMELAKKSAPEVALVDIGMPVMDGFELAVRLRQEPALAKMVLVALTGYGQDEDFQKSRAAGFDHHLIKPVDMEALRRVLKKGNTGSAAAT
jgi:signal transduction histidine kinase/CheY-like chemotaxis protein